MKKYIALLICLSLVMLSSCSVFCEHEWEEANCYNPKVCKKCEKVEGRHIEHKWSERTCSDSQHCTLCGAIKAPPLEHEWTPATCMSPEICSECSTIRGALTNHSWKEANCESPEKCEICGLTRGEISDHIYTTAVIKAASSYSKGSSRYDCTICGHSETKETALPSLSANEIYEYALERVCEIVVGNGYGYSQGSGFLISADGLIVTNHHVIDYGGTITVTFNDKEYTNVEVLDSDKDIDLAVLKIHGQGLPYFNVAKSGYREGDTIYAFGSPIGFTSTLSQGIISSADREVDGRLCVQHDASITHGNSGSPLINEFGEVIGVNTFTYEDSQNLNFAVAISELDNLYF